MKEKKVGIKDGVELYCPVAETPMEERELELRRERFANFMVEMAVKYEPEIIAKGKVEINGNRE